MGKRNVNVYSYIHLFHEEQQRDYTTQTPEKRCSIIVAL